jgi:Family of unknown function (DUF5694)
MRSRATIAALTLWAASALPAVSQQSLAQRPAAPARAEVLVLGVYHMSNPGRDVVNMQADDVLAPKRQAEIAEVIAVLKRFHPTKIAVEAGFDDDAISKRYGDYLAGRHELTRDETEQIGFRLAKELGHKWVYPVDADGEFPFPRLADYAKAHGRTKEFDTLMREIGERVKAANAYLASHTVLETLLHMNSDEHVTEDVGFYYRQAHLGEPWDWAGADLVSDWFRRNMRIYSNVVQLVDSPNERVLVIFGAGHLGWLQHDFASDPTLRLRKLVEFAK